jgi:hypothetical protein
MVLVGFCEKEEEEYDRRKKGGLEWMRHERKICEWDENPKIRTERKSS